MERAVDVLRDLPIRAQSKKKQATESVPRPSRLFRNTDVLPPSQSKQKRSERSKNSDTSILYFNSQRRNHQPQDQTADLHPYWKKQSFALRLLGDRAAGLLSAFPTPENDHSVGDSFLFRSRAWTRRGFVCAVVVGSEEACVEDCGRLAAVVAANAWESTEHGAPENRVISLAINSSATSSSTL